MNQESVPLPADKPTVAVFISRRPESFRPTLKTLLAVEDSNLVIGTANLSALGTLAQELDLRAVESSSPASLINLLWQQSQADILGVWDAILAPPDFLSFALKAMREDPRVATISFLSNAAGFLSFPHPNLPVGRPPEGQDEVSVTRLLRSIPPSPQVTPIPVAAGPAVLISSSSLGAVGPLDEESSISMEGLLLDFSIKSANKGFLHLVDMGTFYSRPSDLTIEEGEDHTRTRPPEVDRNWLRDRHRVADILMDQADMTEGSWALEFQCTKSKIEGLTVLIDGTCLGPQEMGSQVTTLSLIGALADQPDIREVFVSLSTELPSYAAQTFNHPKVKARLTQGGDLSGLPPVDIGHRPFQPDESFDVQAWRSCAKRVVISLLDLIAYRTAAYHASAPKWRAYRESFVRSLSRTDGVVGIANDVKSQANLERFPIDPTRFFVVPPGTDHLQGEESSRIPEELLKRGFVANEFLLILGATYAHKNRDLAMQAFKELLNRGWNLRLILVGAGVPFGSTRIEETKVGLDDSTYLSVPDVSYEGRNWLLKHAAALLYPTSAEGFGFIPHEAARFGTPTVFVSFGPLAEVVGAAEVTASDWRPSALADGVERLLRDPQTARNHVEETLKSGAKYTWSCTAEELVKVYRSLLARPPSNSFR